MNKLANESSLYLRQHAHNPVNWYAWSDEAWAKAQAENKLVLISIGYSSCHWCHVMEKECFEDVPTAEIMNKHFVCIKVDREERPDIDQVYMMAVQLMTGQGGWPLNCFALPDGKPIYGGTYFPKPQWQNVLIQLNEFYKNNPAEANKYGDELTKGIMLSETAEVRNIKKADATLLADMVERWKKRLDHLEGGPDKAPKFALPNNYSFLLRYAVMKNDSDLLEHIKLTLKKIAYGGIYDHVGGGFARYSTDTLWKVPHFEKMLYDNAQLVSLYSETYRHFKFPLFKEVVYETIGFLKKEMSDEAGAYYSALDADSEGVEGKFYVWTEAELKSINWPKAGDHEGYKVFSDYFNVNKNGYWEHDNYILLRKKDDGQIAKEFNLTPIQLKDFITQCKTILYEKRESRVRPALDKKVITSWNALLVIGFCSAYKSFGDEMFLKDAIESINRLLEDNCSDEGIILHVNSAKGKQKIGYLEDYAFVISALLNLYEVTFDEKWLLKAKEFSDYTMRYFFDEQSGYFWFNSSEDEKLVARKKEIHDNVIPASNSEMAKNLYRLSRYFEDENTKDISIKMAVSLQNEMMNYGSAYSNYSILLCDLLNEERDVVITGPNANEFRKEIQKQFLPGILFAGSTKDQEYISLLKGRIGSNETRIFYCKNKMCKLPAKSVDDFILQLHQ